MRAIIIEEERFPEILELLRLEIEKKAKSDPEWESAILGIHRLVHYHLVRWMQSHGAKGIGI